MTRKRKGGSLTQKIKITNSATNSVCFANYVSDLSLNNKEEFLFLITLKICVIPDKPPLRGGGKPAGLLMNTKVILNVSRK